MSRKVPPDRFRQLVEAATTIFIRRGYRATQIADVAEALGVAKGTIYGYVESKEALFDAAVHFADGHATWPEPSELPLRTPAPGKTVAYIQQRVAAEAAEMKLVLVVSAELVIRNARRELAAVLGDLYQRIARNRLALKLIDRCATEYPELAAAWFDGGRGMQVQLLAQLLTQRSGKRGYRVIGDPSIVARTMIEVIAFWGMHRHFGDSLGEVDDATAERAVIELLSVGLLGAT